MQNDGNQKDSKLFKSRIRTCESCGKEFIVPGRLGDYIYKVKGKYACCYHCYLTMKKSASRKPIENSECFANNPSQNKLKQNTD